MSADQHPGSGLAVHDLSVQYGGAIALDHVSLDAPFAQITGLIGPNGAGKTSFFNATSGLIQPSTGSVVFDGTDVTSARPYQRAQLGMGRTFQRMELFDSLTVRQNVALGREARLAGALPWRHVIRTRRERELVTSDTDRAMSICGIEVLANRTAGSLSTGQRRLVELGRAVAGGFPFLLLDEPSSGLDRTETADFARILRTLAAEDGCGILLVEHDMTLVMGICEHLVVLDFGKHIFKGTPIEAQSSPTVRAAYLGETR